MVKRYRVTLTAEERQQLQSLARKRTAPVRMVRRAQALLMAAEDKTDEMIAEQLRMGVATLERLRRRFVEEGLEGSLRERPRPGARPKLGPKEQAFAVALACTKPPEGRRRWTMQLLADRHFPDATTIRVVLDNLNTHTPTALYEAFAPTDARRKLHRLYPS
jgi:transposase